MNNLQRKEFLKKLGLLSLGAAILPDFLFASEDPAVISAPTFRTLRRAGQIDFGLIDLHFHSLKIYLWNKQMNGYHVPLPGDNMIQMQTDIHRIEAGKMKGFLVTHYLPEARMSTDMTTLEKFYPVVELFDPLFKARQGTQTPDNFEQLLGMIGKTEEQLTELAIVHKYKIKVVRNFAQFKEAMAEKYIAVAHAIEGSHALGQKLGSTQDYLDNINTLKRIGVAQITLSHFFENDLSWPVEGMAPNEKVKTGWNSWHFEPDHTTPVDYFNDFPLKEVGQTVVREMFKVGIIVDLTHSTPQVRKDVFKINREDTATTKPEDKGKPKRPLVFSHVGVQKLFDVTTHAEYKNFKYYCVSDDEIKEVIASDGVIGVIFENYWLTGRNMHIPGNGAYNPWHYHKAIANVIETIKYIKDVTDGYYKDAGITGRSYDHIAIGSDFDGLADSPWDLVTPARLPHLAKEMYKNDIPADAVAKIMNGNVMRVLEKGWN